MRILLYHNVTQNHPEEIHDVTVEAFGKQMAWLKQSGFQVISIEQWLANPGQYRSDRVAAITFDDGYLDNYTNAMPVLRRHDYTATVFLVAGAVGGSAGWSRPGASTPFLSWAQVREMMQLGFTFGSHTLTHPDLTQLPEQDVEKELRHSRRQIEEETGQPVECFAYPFSRHKPDITRQVEAAGYRAAFTYRPWYVGNPGTKRFELQRIGVLATDSLHTFSAKVRAAPQKRLLWWRRLIGQAVKGSIRPLTNS